MSWFSKTSTFNYADLRDDVKAIIHRKIDQSIAYLYQSANAYTFQFIVGTTVLLTRDSYVKNIPEQVYFDSVERILRNIPFIIYPNGDNCYFTVCIVHNPVSNIPHPIGTRLACAAIYQAKDANEICAITMEPLRSLTSFAVSQCGHVFDASAATLSMCPLCKASVAWSICSPTPGPVTIL
jgi:hypothetical protein